MALAQRYLEKSAYTEEEYLRWETDAVTKSEFCNGEIRAMSGGMEDHNTISANVIAALVFALKGRKCRVMTPDMKIWTPPGTFYYPDVTVTCGQREYYRGSKAVITNPLLLVEVLSPGTEGKDRGEKWLHYQTIETLTDYLLVSQEAPTVEHFGRIAPGHWNYASVTGTESVLSIASLSVTLALSDIYDQIDFESA